MKLNKLIAVLSLLLILAGTAFAQKIVIGSTVPGGTALENDLKDIIGDINASPTKFMTGFADASIFASHGATQRAFGDYKLFSFTLGVTTGLRVHTNPSNFISEYEKLQDTLNDKGDLTIGTSPGINAQVGINASFLLKGLYLGVRFGYLDLKKDRFPISKISIDDLTRLDFNMLHIGAVANYQVLEGVNLGAFRWRGLEVGTGFLFQRTTYGFNFALGEISDGSNKANPELYFDMKTTTYTIPVEINTAIQLLWFLNLGIGAGADFAFGKNKLSFGADSPVYDGSNTYQGQIFARGGGSTGPTFFNPKVMANLGIKLGPVIIDIPAAYYFNFNGDGSTGLSIGITMGVVF